MMEIFATSIHSSTKPLKYISQQHQKQIPIFWQVVIKRPYYPQMVSNFLFFSFHQPQSQRLSLNDDRLEMVTHPPINKKKQTFITNSVAISSGEPSFVSCQVTYLSHFWKLQFILRSIHYKDHTSLPPVLCQYKVYFRPPSLSMY